MLDIIQFYLVYLVKSPIGLSFIHNELISVLRLIVFLTLFGQVILFSLLLK